MACASEQDGLGTPGATNHHNHHNPQSPQSPPQPPQSPRQIGYQSFAHLLLETTDKPEAVRAWLDARGACSHEHETPGNDGGRPGGVSDALAPKAAPPQPGVGRRRTVTVDDYETDALRPPLPSSAGGP